MLNKFLKSLSLVLLLNLLVKPFWVLFIDRLVQEQVGNVAFGMFQTFTSFTLIFSIILDPGLKNYYNTNLSYNRDLHQKITGEYLIIKLLLGLVFFALLSIVAFSSADYQQHWPLFLLLAFNHLLLSFLLFFRATLTGLGHYQKDSIMSVVDRIVMIVLAIPLFFTSIFNGYKTVETFAIIHTIGYIVALLICLLFLGEQVFQIKFKTSYVNILQILKHSFPFALFTGLMTLYIYADFIMIERMLPNGFESVGLYRKSYRFLEAASMFALLFGNLLLPVFSSMQNKQNEVSQMIKVVFKIFVIPSIFMALLCFFYSKPLMFLAYPNESSIVSENFGLLMLDFVAISLFYLFGTALTAMKQLKWLNIIAAVGVVLNIALNLSLIPSLGIKGAVIATICTHGAVGILQMTLTLKKYNILIRPAVIGRIIGFTTFTIASFKYIYILNIDWIFEVITMSALSFTFALLFKVFSFKEIFILLKSNADE